MSKYVPVLLMRLGKLDLGAESFLGRHLDGITSRSDGEDGGQTGW